MSALLLRDWAWCAYYAVSGSYQITDYGSAVLPTSIPRLSEKIAELGRHGFVLLDDEIPVYKSIKETTNNKIEIVYNINHDCRFRNGEVILKVLVKRVQCASVDEAVSGAICTNLSLHFDGDPVDGGKGQIGKCRKIADEIFEKWGHLKGFASPVIVPYKTRGGRGGWKPKIAERSFEYPIGVTHETTI